MKKFIYGAMMLGLVSVFSACEDDRDDNPTLTPATDFVLNTPVFANNVFDVATSNELAFTYSQPNWAFPLVCDYTLQYSLTGTFTVSVDEAEADETGAKVADYQVSDPTTAGKLLLPAVNFAKGLQQLGKWTEGLVPSGVEVTARVMAIPSQYSVADRKEVEKYVIYSNPIKFKVDPCYVELSDAPIVMWYLVGNLFGGKWGNVPGETALPMFITPDWQYDKKTGTGQLTYTNYFITGPWDDGKNECGSAGFKIQPDNFNWDYGMTGNNNVYDEIIYRDGGGDGGHIVVGADGYYIIKMDTEKKAAKFEKLDVTPAVFDKMCMSGSFNEWSDTEMLPYNKEGIENHTWYLVVNFDADQEVKFKQADSWDNNWGSDAFPVGVGASNGPNIPVPAGSWIISFCDITGEYSIIAK